jgi:hypothetical protein
MNAETVMETGPAYIRRESAGAELTSRQSLGMRYVSTKGRHSAIVDVEYQYAVSRYLWAMRMLLDWCRVGGI